MSFDNMSIDKMLTIRAVGARKLALSVLVAGSTAVLLAGCDRGPKSGYGFTLPEGDAEAGAQTFVALECTACHSIPDNKAISQPDNPQMSIALGGRASTIKTYGKLVTSIINPSHKLARGYPKSLVAEDGRSRMRVYNDVMTVQQLTDLVTFLQDQYYLQPFEPSEYPLYP